MNSKCSMADHIKQAAEQAPAAFRFDAQFLCFLGVFNFNLLCFQDFEKKKLRLEYTRGQFDPQKGRRTTKIIAAAGATEEAVAVHSNLTEVA